MNSIVVLLCSTFGIAAATAPKPNIVYILIDDYGWADAGWHRPPGYKDVQTPNLNALVAEGVELDRHYVYQFCSPTRSAVQSGRNPIHVNVLNLDPAVRNADDPVSGYAGVPRNMTGMAEHLKYAGYETHMYGKWDAGMATPQQTPRGRGYDSSLCYFHHMNDYWNNTEEECNGQSMVDLYQDTAPAWGVNNSQECSQQNQAEGCIYEDHLFYLRAMAAIENRNQSKPLFLFWAPHSIHAPLQVPTAYLEKFNFINDTSRQLYHAMVDYIDESIGNVTGLLKSNGMWDDTLIILHADNGGPIYNSGADGGNNYPLKGGKMSNWEGGIRVNAFASGGFLPEKVRGTKNEGYMCGWDWYTTFCALAGVDHTDHKAAAAGLPPVDGVNLWPFLSGEVDESPRTVIPIGDHVDNTTVLGGVIVGDYKILFGNLGMSGWTGPVFPNTTSSWNPSNSHERCGRTSSTGCLFNIRTDPTEHVNLAATHADIFEHLNATATEIEKTLFNPKRGAVDPEACKLGLTTYKGFWGPFAFLN